MILNHPQSVMICKVLREGWGGGCVCTWSTVNLWRSEATVDVAVTFHLSETGPLWFLSLCTWGSCPTSFLTVSTAYLTLETMGYGYMLCGCFCGVLENLHGVPLPHSRTSSHWAFPKALHYLLCVCHKNREMILPGSDTAWLRLKAYGEFLFVLSSSLPLFFILWTTLSFNSQWNLGNDIVKV